jgi:hypothetical protein
MSSRRYTTISEQKSMDTFLDLTRKLHDSIAREISVVSRGNVLPDRSMLGDMSPRDARIVFQSMFEETPCIDVVFEEVIDMHLGAICFIDDACGEFKAGNVHFSFDDSAVTAKKMKYRILGNECLGLDLLTVEEIAAGDMVDAIALEDGYIQCPNCCNAWKPEDIKVTATFSKCSTCGSKCIFP